MALTLRDKQSNYYFRETLSSALRGLVGKFTVVDIRNESSVYGKIHSVTAFMDIEMEKCIFKNSKGDFFPFENFYLKSRNIRYVHIPEGYTCKQLMETGMQSNKLINIKGDKKKNIFKKKRAQNYQLQILKDLQQQKDSE